ncbi:MAG TPA: DUF4288 domain-containing protein [Candidatus Limnocylindria bacterium]|nr:DUF4288 domain-containing protein [Candidatus Limnocylindria bacterium]
MPDARAAVDGRPRPDELRSLAETDALDPVVDPSGWFSVQLRYAYLVGEAQAEAMIEDRVVLVDGEDEETALGRAIEIAEEYEDEFETEAGEAGQIRFEGIVAIKELDDPPAAGTEVWHEFMSPAGVQIDADGEPLPALRPEEMAFPRAHEA